MPLLAGAGWHCGHVDGNLYGAVDGPSSGDAQLSREERYTRLLSGDPEVRLEEDMHVWYSLLRRSMVKAPNHIRHRTGRQQMYNCVWG